MAAGGRLEGDFAEFDGVGFGAREPFGLERIVARRG